MNIEVRTITPADAKQMLARNGINRPLNKAAVQHYAQAMRAGEWRFNGDAIRVAESGELLDGQHRLEGVVESDTPIQTVVITGLAEEVFDTIDSGRKRSAGDVLGIAKIPDSSNVAAAARWLSALRKSDGAVISHRAGSLDAHGVLVYVRENYRLVELVAKCRSHRNQAAGGLAAPLAAALWLLFEEKDAKAAEGFFRDLYVGAGLDEGDPVLTLRNKLFKDQRDNSGRARTAGSEVSCWVIRAWNARRAGQKLTTIRGPVESPKTGELLFPTIA